MRPRSRTQETVASAAASLTLLSRLLFPLVDSTGTTVFTCFGPMLAVCWLDTSGHDESGEQKVSLF